VQTEFEFSQVSQLNKDSMVGELYLPDKDKYHQQHLIFFDLFPF
jgi:hypothetical protein